MFAIVSVQTSTNKKRNKKDIRVPGRVISHLTFDLFQLMRALSGANKGGLLWGMQRM